MFENIVSNSQQFNARNDVIVLRGVHDVGVAKYTKKLETKIDALTTLVNQLVANQRVALSITRVYGISTSVDHFTNSCPDFQQVTTSASSDTPQAYAANIFNHRSP